MLVSIRQRIGIKNNISVSLEFTLCTLCLTSSNIFLHTKICPLAVLLETAEQTLWPGMYDLIVLVNIPSSLIAIKITQTFQVQKIII